MYPYVRIGPVSMPSYGLCLVTGALLAFLLLLYTRRFRGVKRDDIYHTAIYAVIGGLIGAKLLYLIVELPAILRTPAILLSMILGGAVFYGGLIGGVAGGLIYTRRYKTSVLDTADVLLPSLALAHAFGRVGCFFAGCCYGMACDSPISVVYPPGAYPPPGIPLLPTQLMETAFLLLLCLFLTLRLKKSKKSGEIAGFYALLYGVWRFIIEFFRGDPRGSLWIFSTSQLISLALIPLGLFLLLREGKSRARSA
ncbi:MAG: prolipoprotein diacylglyceryl transferase [Clostridiaceae bacterium]